MDPEALFQRARKLALEVVLFCRTFKSVPEARVIQYQLIKSATSMAANYRAARCARSRREWFSKLSIVVEEADETYFWVDFVKDLNIAKYPEHDQLIQEALEMTKIFSTMRARAKSNRNTAQEPKVPYHKR